MRVVEHVNESTSKESVLVLVRANEPETNPRPRSGTAIQNVPPVSTLAEPFAFTARIIVAPILTGNPGVICVTGALPNAVDAIVLLASVHLRVGGAFV
jgi:hypothetical protein